MFYNAVEIVFRVFVNSYNNNNNNNNNDNNDNNNYNNYNNKLSNKIIYVFIIINNPTKLKSISFNLNFGMYLVCNLQLTNHTQLHLHLSS
jgi:hypothetical protein